MGRLGNKDRGLVQYPDGKWGINCYLKGKRYRLKCDTKTEARQKYEDLKRSERHGEHLPVDPPLPAPPARRTLAHWLQLYLDTAPRTQGDGSRRRGQPDRLHAKNWIRQVGHMLPEHLTREHLAAWVRNEFERQRKGRGRTSKDGKKVDPGRPSAGYIKRQLAVLRRAFEFAIQANEITSHPFTDWTALGLPKSLNNARESFLTPEQEGAFFTELGPRWCLYAEFAILTGLRQGSQFSLRTEDVDLERGVAMVAQAKHGERQPVILSARAAAIIRELQEKHPGTWIFSSPTGRRAHPDNFRERVWRPALTAAGLGTDFRWHDLRHTAASRLVEQGVELYTVQLILGHRDHRTTQRYAHLKDEKIKAAMEVLAAATGRAPAESEPTENRRSEKPTPGKMPIATG